MSYKEMGGFCPACNENVLIRKKTPNHILHLLLTVVTLGWWSIIWIIAVLGGKPWLCVRCGKTVKQSTIRWTNG